METLWFVLVCLMFTVYVVLDGFDLGAGALHCWIAKGDDERRTVLNAIGPVWDGNEVWLIAGGGVMYFAFPTLYAAAFSGFYLPLIMVLWLLMMRGLGIEMRHHVSHPMWQSFWDVSFMLGSGLLAFVFGAALGNVVRGVPLAEDGKFFLPLWNRFLVETDAGVLDWFTVLMGMVSLAVLTVHGAAYLVWKTTGEVERRAHRVVSVGGWIIVVLLIMSLPASLYVRPAMWERYTHTVIGWIFPLMTVAGIVGLGYYNRAGQSLKAFLSSCVFIAGALAATAFAMYPSLLPSSINPTHDLTIYNSAAQSYGLTTGLVWWSIGIVLVIAYFITMFRSFRGKVRVDEHGY